jgi:hypothetical protein
MNGRATGNGGANGRDRRVSHFMKAQAAAALLSERHGEANARKVALTEQQKARRARSKRRFAFWGEVAARIENGNCNNAADTRPAGWEARASIKRTRSRLVADRSAAFAFGAPGRGDRN